MLSNTATPRYYGQFRDAVLRMEIPVCREISMEMNRIDALIENPQIYYDEDAVEGYIKYCENELTLTDGSNLVLLDSFKLWAEQIFGWWYFVEKSVYEPNPEGGVGHYVTKVTKKRLINKQYLIVARGAAKSMYVSTIQSYFLNIDTTTTHQVATAPTMRQAEEVISPIRTSITRARGPLFKFLTEGSVLGTSNKATRQKLAATKKGIENFLTGSLLEVRPMTIDKLQGLQVKIASVDEWLSGDIREDVISALEQGGSKLDDYLILATSSEGTVRNGAGDSIKMELLKILKGEYIAPHVSIWYYRLDDIKEVGMPEMWVKANPNIDKIVSYETYQLDVERAEQNPSARNDILAKRFGIPMEGYTYYFTYEETLPCNRILDFYEMRCALGIDLSQGDDFCAFTFLFPLPDGSFGIKVLSYITERTLFRLGRAARIKYEEFRDERTLVVMPGSRLDMMAVYDDVDRHIIDHHYEVCAVGYDPYNAKEFIERWSRENSAYAVEKVIQGVKTESVPLGELKHMAEDKQLLFDEQLMSYSMGNAVTLEDTNGNRKLLKMRYEDKIDNVSALMDAWVAFKLHPDEFE